MPSPETFNVSDNTITQPVENVGVAASSVWNQNSMSDWRTASSAGRADAATGLPDFGIDFGTSNDNASNSALSDNNKSNDDNATNISFDSSVLNNSTDGASTENPTAPDRTSESNGRTSQDHDEKPTENPSGGLMKRPLQDAPPRLDVAGCTPPGPRQDGSQGWDRVINALSDVTQYRRCLDSREEGIREYNRQRAEDERRWQNHEAGTR